MYFILALAIIYLFFLFLLRDRTGLNPKDMPEFKHIYKKTDSVLLSVELKSFHGIPHSEYVEYLKTERWKTFKFKRYMIDKCTCQMCRCNLTFATSHCHHITYERLTSERMSDIITLCKDCHNKLHKHYPRNAKYYPIISI